MMMMMMEGLCLRQEERKTNDEINKSMIYRPVSVF